MDLLALADFTLVARHRGFGKAARAAARPKATLSRRMAELGASQGLCLSQGGARDLKLTEEGRVLFEVTGLEITLWALHPSRRLLSARVSALLHLLKQAFPPAAPEELAAYLDM